MGKAAIVTTIRKFREEYNKNYFTDVCHDFVKDECSLPVDNANDRSWDDCYDFLFKYLPRGEKYQNFHLVFEYVMPESLKRADVLILSKDKILSLEFKEKNRVLRDDIAQAAGYGQSITHYHYMTEENDMLVSTYLVYTPGDPTGNHDLVDILCPINFTKKIEYELEKAIPMADELCDKWVKSPFHPLKNIAEATLQLFRDGNLPNIKTIREGDIEDTISKINNIIDDHNINKSIIFVSGVPGSGKTLVGLKTVYDHACPNDKLNPIYLSGNDPLVNILQHTLSTNNVDLEGGSYIQSMKKFKENAHEGTIPVNNIIVFDEAQRAWDIDKKEKNQTEATLLLRIGDRIAEHYGKVTIVCLIGDGQAIHKYEEAGIKLWADAVDCQTDWDVYVPENYSFQFKKTKNCHIIPELLLKTSIRNDFIDVSQWVESILALDIDRARSLYREMLKQGFKCYYFRDKECLPKTVQYIKKNFIGSHTGIVVSSHLKGNNYFGKQYRGSYIRAEEAYSWYMNEGPLLTRGASEFLIQGIELEFPIVSFIGDYYIKNGKWELKSNLHFDKEIRDKDTLIKNVYRVILTRSRKGMFLYFPQDDILDETYKWFVNMLKIS
mgnify:FL=1